MKTEKVLPTILDAAKDIRESYKLYGVSDYVKQYDSMLLGGYTWLDWGIRRIRRCYWEWWVAWKLIKNNCWHHYLDYL